MKSYKYISLMFMVVFIVLSGCKKYETYPVDQVNIDRIFNPNDSLGTNAFRFLVTTYAVLRSGHNRLDGKDYLDAATDDAVPSAASSSNQATLLSTGSFNSGTFSNDLTNSNNENVWATYYGGIRKANLVINNIDVVPVKETLPASYYPVGSPKVSAARAWKCEARFLRAFFYFEMVKRYGGVVLLGDKVLDPHDDLKLPRNSFAECIDYIVKECDAIKDTLYRKPIPSSAYGRATQGAALALKAHVLLYAASPLYNAGNIDPANNLTGYVAADATADKVAQRWAAAEQAAKDIIDLGSYSLFDNAGKTGFRDMFFTQDNSEVIFQRNVKQGSTAIETNNAPVGFISAQAKGNTSPTQDLVDAFPMSTGVAIGAPGSGYNANNPYQGRDPRLGFSVFYHGHPWLSTTIKVNEGGQSRPNTGIQQTVTGYYLRKFMGVSETTPTFTSHLDDWVIFRYAEVLLNYAEAKNEIEGPTADVVNALRAIRQRAGIAPGANLQFGLVTTTDKDVMRDIIRNERRIEMAFEEQRFYDIRRWKLAGEGAAVLTKPKTGMRIISSVSSTTYSVENILPDIFPATAFNKRRYFMPIPYDEVVKNPNMKQNPGWE